MRNLEQKWSMGELTPGAVGHSASLQLATIAFHLDYITLHYIVLQYATLYYVTLRYITSFHGHFTLHYVRHSLTIPAHIIDYMYGQSTE